MAKLDLPAPFILKPTNTSRCFVESWPLRLHITVVRTNRNQLLPRPEMFSQEYPESRGGINQLHDSVTSARGINEPSVIILTVNSGVVSGPYSDCVIIHLDLNKCSSSDVTSRPTLLENFRAQFPGQRAHESLRNPTKVLRVLKHLTKRGKITPQSNLQMPSCNLVPSLIQPLCLLRRALSP